MDHDIPDPNLEALWTAGDPDDPMNGDDWAAYMEGPSPAHAEQAAAVAEVRQEMGGPVAIDTSDNPEADAYIRERFPSVDWEAAFAKDWSQVDWLPGKFMERGQQVSLVGDGKAGKSLFVLEWAWRAAAGRSFLGERPRDPIRVLYLDKENSPRDLITRAISLGAKPNDLQGLAYKQFPKFSGSLDAPAEKAKAARELLALVHYHRADVVIIDTVSRFIGGKENDSDTWLQLYQQMHERLKHAGVACIRLDHFGKDDTKGSRGSSAKSQDVDHVWELGRVNERSEVDSGVETITTGLKLHRTHTRSGLGRGAFPMNRVGRKTVEGLWLPGQTFHALIDDLTAKRRDADESAEVFRMVDEIRRAGFKGAPTKQSVMDFCKGRGIATKAASFMVKVTAQLKDEMEIK